MKKVVKRVLAFAFAACLVLGLVVTAKQPIGAAVIDIKVDRLAVGEAAQYIISTESKAEQTYDGKATVKTSHPGTYLVQSILQKWNEDDGDHRAGDTEYWFEGSMYVDDTILSEPSDHSGYPKADEGYSLMVRYSLGVCACPPEEELEGKLDWDTYEYDPTYTNDFTFTLPVPEGYDAASAKYYNKGFKSVDAGSGNTITLNQKMNISFSGPAGYIMNFADDFGLESEMNGFVVEYKKSGAGSDSNSDSDSPDNAAATVDKASEAANKDMAAAIASTDKGGTIKQEVVPNVEISKETIQAAKDKGQKLEITAKSETGAEVATWAIASITNDVAFNPTVTVDAKIEAVESKLTEAKLPETTKVTQVSFAHDGDLPGEAEVTLALPKTVDFTEGSTVYLYYFNPSVKLFEQIDTAKCTGGKATFTMTHCSDYIVTSEALPVNLLVPGSPGTGDGVNVALMGMIFFMGMAAVLFAKKREVF